MLAHKHRLADKLTPPRLMSSFPIRLDQRVQVQRFFARPCADDSAHVGMQVDSKTGVVTASYEPPAAVSQQQREVGCTDCQRVRESHHLTATVGASVGGGLVVLMLVAGGDLAYAVTIPLGGFCCVTIDML